MNTHQEKQKEYNYEFKKFVSQVLLQWHWVALFLIIGFTAAYLTVRYTSSIYIVSASFVTKKFDKTPNNPLLQLAETQVMLQENIQISQEIPLLKSQERIQETLDRLDFNVSYFLVGRLKASEIYPADFYRVQFNKDTKVPYGIPFYVETEDHLNFTLSTEDPVWSQVVDEKLLKFNQPFDLGGWQGTINRISKNGNDLNNRHYFVINRPEFLLAEYRSKLQLSWQKSNSQILDARIESELPEKAFDFLRTYLQVIVDKGLEEKNKQFTNTLMFINEYLPQISDSIRSYQSKVNAFQLENRLLVSDETKVFDKIDALESEKSELQIANQYFNYLIAYLKEDREEGIFAPAMIGIDAPPMSDLMRLYTEAKWLDRIDKNPHNKENPLVNRSASELDRIRQNIFESARNLQAANTAQIRRLTQNISDYYQSIRGFQSQSQEYAEVLRQVELYETVYYNLITRRTEVFIAQAATVSDYEMVTNPGYNKNMPVSPNQGKIYLVAIAFGLGLPLGFIYLRQLMNNTVMSVKELAQNTQIPILGTVGHSLESDNLAVHHAPKSLVAESFRGIRASLEYLGKDSNIKVILITSSGSGEGKTFCSANLAFTYALSQKKVLLIGADMRKPTLSKSFGLIDQTGLSDYLAGLNTLEEAVHQSDHEFLDLIPGGSIPPNPAELLMSKRMVELDKWARKNYEYIIIDSPPVSLVADAFELMKYSNINLLIVRQGVTDKESFKFINDRQEKGQLHHLSILFNDVEFRKVDYGYKAYGPYSYGYGYYSEEHTRKSFWKRLFGRL